MKFFSWSTLALIISVAFLWGCGYWVLLQTGAVVVQQQRTELSHQLDKAVVALQHWQDRYELPLQALQQRLNALPAQQSEVLASDPWQELDLHIHQILWPDPLHAYAVVNRAGKVLRFSDDSADQLFSHSRRLPTQQLMFLAPQVYRSHWMLPVQVPLSTPAHASENDMQLILWFDGARLAAQLDAMRPESAAESEFLLVDNAGALLSRSRYQDRLLPMLRMDDIQGWQPLQLWLRRPPVPLLASGAQKFDATLAWPPSHIVSLLRQKGPAFSQKTYLNYLGRPTLAAWQQLDSWQANVLLERDASAMLAHIATQRQQLFLLLFGISVALVLLFFVVQRRLQWSEQISLTEPEPPFAADDTLMADTLPDAAFVHATSTQSSQAVIPAAQTSATKDIALPQATDVAPRMELSQPMAAAMFSPAPTALKAQQPDAARATNDEPSVSFVTTTSATAQTPPEADSDICIESGLTPALFTELQAHAAADTAVTSAVSHHDDDWQMASRLLEAWMYAPTGREQPPSRHQLSLVTQQWLQQQSSPARTSSVGSKDRFASTPQDDELDDPALAAMTALLAASGVADDSTAVATVASAPEDSAARQTSVAATWQAMMADVTPNMVLLPTKPLLQRWLRLLQQQMRGVQTAVIEFSDTLPAWIAVSTRASMPSIRLLEQQFMQWADTLGTTQPHAPAMPRARHDVVAVEMSLHDTDTGDTAITSTPVAPWSIPSNPRDLSFVFSTQSRLLVEWQSSDDPACAKSDGQLCVRLLSAPDITSDTDRTPPFVIMAQRFDMNASFANIAEPCAATFATPLDMPRHATSTHSQPRVLLLSPPSQLQQHLKRQLIQHHCLLLPLGDATQLLGFLSNNQEPLDHLVVDEAFIASDPALLPKIAQVVRRYFPAARLHLVHSAHSIALAHAGDYQCLALPLLPDDWSYVLGASAAVRSLMIQSDDVVAGWRLQQRLHELGWQAQLAPSSVDRLERASSTAAHPNHAMTELAWLLQSAQQWRLVNSYGQSVELDAEKLSQAMLSQALFYWLLTGKKR